MTKLSAPPRTDTVRQALELALAGGVFSAVELSGLVRHSQRDVLAHLEHVRRSHGAAFHIHPARCNACRYRFVDRTRLAKPSRCPRCRAERVTAPKFELRVTR